MDDVPAMTGQFFAQTAPGEFREEAANRGGWPLRSPNPEVRDEAKVERLWRETVAVVEAYEAACGAGG